jgi:sulfite dehydrogenase (cytochrome) subunit B
MSGRRLKLGLPAAFLASGLALNGFADEPPVALKDAPGHDVVEHSCAGCHSLDYLSINAKFLDRRGWQAEVTKMIKVFGAAISPADRAVIIDYLARNYGVGG